MANVLPAPGSGAPSAEDPERAPDPQGRPHPHVAHAGAVALSLGALGVVFGDIGTSPLYALQAVFSADNHAVKATEGDVYGVISLVFWSVTIIVSVKYLTFIMRADNDGEGGIMALIALIQQVKLSRAAKVALVLLGEIGRASCRERV